MQSITKECEVEVSYDKDGVKGAWYRAILEDIPTKSEHTLLRVRYKTLLKEDRSSHLSEIVDHSLIRPVPPKDDGAVLGEGSVVDAYYKGGWWSGLVVKKTEEDGTYLVSFDSPPDISYFERKQLRAHLDWSGSKWFRPETKEVAKSLFSPGTMVELRLSSAWRTAVIVKKVENEESFIVKYCDDRSFRRSQRSRITVVVDSRDVRPRQPPLWSVGEYELLDHVEVVCGSVWSEGVVRGILFKGRYMISFGKTKVASVQVSCSDLRPPMEWEDGIWHKRSKTKSKIFGKCYSRKRKRGQVEHNSDLNDTVQTPTSNVEDTQAKDTMMVLPFACKSPLWKIYETMEVFKTLPQHPHFSPLIESTSEDFREGSALGMMATFSGLLEKLKDLETDVSVSQLDSLKDSFSKLEKHGFDVTRPLSRINKVLALKDRQLKILEERRGLDKERMDESNKRRKAELEFGETKRKMVEVKHKILELQRQEAALIEKKEAAEEQKDEACRKIWKVESCARDVAVKLEDVEFDFETLLSAPW